MSFSTTEKNLFTIFNELHTRLQNFIEQFSHFNNDLQQNHALFQQELNQHNRQAKAKLLQNLPQYNQSCCQQAQACANTLDEIHQALEDLFQQTALPNKLAKKITRTLQIVLAQRQQQKTIYSLIDYFKQQEIHWYSRQPAPLLPNITLPSAPQANLAQLKRDAARELLKIGISAPEHLVQQQAEIELHNASHVIVRELPSLAEWQQECVTHLQKLDALTKNPQTHSEFRRLHIERELRQLSIKLPYHRSCWQHWQANIAQQYHYLQENYLTLAQSTKAAHSQQRLQALQQRQQALHQQLTHLHRIRELFIQLQTWQHYYEKTPSNLLTSTQHTEFLVNVQQQFPQHQQTLTLLEQWLNALPEDYQRCHTELAKTQFIRQLPHYLEHYQRSLQQVQQELNQQLIQIEQWQIRLFAGRAEQELMQLEGMNELRLQQRQDELVKLSQLQTDLQTLYDRSIYIKAQIQAQKLWYYQQQQLLLTQDEHEQLLQDCYTITQQMAVREKILNQYQQAIQQRELTIAPETLWQMQQDLMAEQQTLVEYWECIGHFSQPEFAELRAHRTRLQPQASLATVSWLVADKHRLKQLLLQLQTQQSTVNRVLAYYIEQRACTHINQCETPNELRKSFHTAERIEKSLRQQTKNEFSKVTLRTWLNVAEQLLTNYYNFDNWRLMRANMKLLLTKINRLNEAMHTVQQHQAQAYHALFSAGGNINPDQLAHAPLNYQHKHIQQTLKTRSKWQQLSQQLQEFLHALDHTRRSLIESLTKLKRLSQASTTYFFVKPNQQSAHAELAPLCHPKHLTNEWRLFHSDTKLHVLLKTHHIKLPKQPANNQQLAETVRQMVDQGITNGWKSIRFSGHNQQLIMVACAYASALNFPIDWDAIPNASFRATPHFQAMVEKEALRIEQTRLPEVTEMPKPSAPERVLGVE
ncbi:MAG: hypothetical protein KIT27_05215 [Legionellales bacterium]|nr:hypothetical protein [Legionellales bacterium]